jgi:hypothetical protein
MNTLGCVRLKCCEHLLAEHQAQLINYLAVTNVRMGLLVNFGKRRLEYKKAHHPAHPAACDPAYPVLLWERIAGDSKSENQ